MCSTRMCEGIVEGGDFIGHPYSSWAMPLLLIIKSISLPAIGNFKYILMAK
uniref:Uncharacterized protein n=1 Tax=Candidatus Methanophaga sp. ANME-1 ERB7 TaxID=2759913 RepID=A0A7G9Z9D0_9EURY|nr:hypothetical protein KGHFPOIM_00006 [Methanosarcinales archaeon ANME-1 ERB7]